MTAIRMADGRVFSATCDLMEVTSMRRPDPSWVVVDSQGHEHRWHVNGVPATAYRPDVTYDTPTLVWVKDGEEYWEDDDEPHDVGHLECRQCGEHICPGYTADSCSQYIKGLTYYRIDGRAVSKEEFEREVERAKG